jgi:hypothetical protein
VGFRRELLNSERLAIQFHVTDNVKVFFSFQPFIAPIEFNWNVLFQVGGQFILRKSDSFHKGEAGLCLGRFGEG